MTEQEELELLLQIMEKHDLPMSPILEYAIRTKMQQSKLETKEVPMVEQCRHQVKADNFNNPISFYLSCFVNLSTGVHNGKRLPHKAVLLLCMMRLIEKGIIKENKICLDGVIANAFTETWEAYMPEQKVPSVWIPFWYMKSEAFWHFKACSDDNMLKNMLRFCGHPSVGQMRQVIKYAYIDEQLFLLIQDKSKRTSLIDALVKTYLIEG